MLDLTRDPSSVYLHTPQLDCLKFCLPERRDSHTKCIFQDGKYQWCIHMEDGGGFNINAALSYGAFS
ncbi:TPA: hypothetical protein ACH3X1_009145, partial [Trebouxia sp. C0004]